MPDATQSQLYLISPPQFEVAVFGDQLAAILDAHAVACMRLTLTSHNEDDIARAADHLREICHARDVAIVIDSHFRLVERLGLDGCHLPDGHSQLRAVRKELGPDAIIGCYCGTSRHTGLTAGEAGADYVAFGPMTASNLGDGAVADIETFQWWSEMIEVPVVAEGGLTPALVEVLAPISDFIALGAEIWDAPDPSAALQALLEPMQG